MKQPVFILITGRPASGKTYLAELLQEQLGVATISKDGIKEILFDSLGIKDRAWSMQLGRATFSIMDYFVEEQLRAGNNIIVESPVNPKFENAKLQQWQQKYKFRAVQILCDADDDVLLERFTARATSTERHPGHNELADLAEHTANLRAAAANQILAIDSKLIQINTTDFSAVNYDAVITDIKHYLFD